VDGEFGKKEIQTNGLPNRSAGRLARRFAKGVLLFGSTETLRVVLSIGGQIILARFFLEPEHFGLFALGMMIVGLFMALGNLEGQRYLIKKEQVDESIHTIFTIQLLGGVFAVGLCIVLFRPAALYVSGPDLVPITAVLILLVPYHLLTFPKGLLEKKLEFEKAYAPMLLAYVSEVAFALTFAWLGFGIWSLVVGRLARTGLEIFFAWMLGGYRPSLAWDRTEIKSLLHYSLPLTFTGVIVFIYSNADYYIVGKLLDVTNVGYYFMVYKIGEYSLLLSRGLGRVMYPTMGALRDEDRLRQVYVSLVRVSLIVATLPCALFLLFAVPIVDFVLGEKWLPTVLPLQIIMVSVVFKMVSAYNEPVLLLKGKTKIYPVLSMINCTLRPGLGWFLTKYYGLGGMAAAVLIATIVVVGIQMQYTVRLIQARLQVLALRTLTFAAVVGGALYGAHRLEYHPAVEYAVVAGIFVLSYFVIFRHDIADVCHLVYRITHHQTSRQELSQRGEADV